MRHYIVSSLVADLILGISTAFTPSSKASLMHHDNCNTFGRFQRHTFMIQHSQISHRHQRHNTARLTQLMGLFGLGGAEIAVILIAVVFLLGPQKLAELGRNAGKLTGELKEVPKEFQKGLMEGEIDVRAKSAKPMDTSDL